MNEIKEYTQKLFEDIKHIDINGNEYWNARELMEVLDYNNWQNFHKVIKQAINTCFNSINTLNDHFIDVSKMVNIGSNTKRKIKDYKLSRYACYLIAQNGNPRKEVIS